MAVASSVSIAKKPRKDPAPRHSDGQATGRRGNRFLLITNANPQHDYAWVWKADEMTGVPYYESLGWEVVQYHEGGPRSAAMRKVRVGEPIEHRGMVLMCITKEERERIYIEGEDGDTGQKWADQIEARIRSKKRADNPFSGGPTAVGASGQRYVQEDPDKSEDPEDLNHG